MLKKTEEIRTFILQNVEKHPRDIGAVASHHFAISRQAVARHLSILVSEGLLNAEGKTKGRTYQLKMLVSKTFKVLLSENLKEDVLWHQYVKACLSNLKKNVNAICYHGFTEMMNNAIDHSEGSEVEIGVERTASGIFLAIEDNGVGIFNKIARELNLSDKSHAILELAKGKLTTDPKKHTGEGIFFTSRMFDTFVIFSDDLSLVHMEGRGDWLLENQEDTVGGTRVFMKIDPQSNRDVLQVFDRFSDPEDFSFSKTHVPKGWRRDGGDFFVSPPPRCH